MFKAIKELFYGFVFLVLCCVMWADRGCSHLSDPAMPEATAPAATPEAVAPPRAVRTPARTRAAKPAPSAKPAGEPETVRQVREAARCWGPACYDHPLGVRTGIPE